MGYVLSAESILNLRKWRAITSSLGAKAGKQRPITVKCFVNPATVKKPINIEMHPIR